jgi:hypothetical protein
MESGVKPKGVAQPNPQAQNEVTLGHENSMSGEAQTVKSITGTLLYLLPVTVGFQARGTTRRSRDSQFNSSD